MKTLTIWADVADAAAGAEEQKLRLPALLAMMHLLCEWARSSGQRQASAGAPTSASARRRSMQPEALQR